MPIEIGHVEAIFRYPVKSMGGERLEVANLAWHGLEGDRRLAFRRMNDRSDFPWLTASKLPDLVRFAPRRSEDGAQGELPTHIRTPDGAELPVFGEDLATEVGRRYDRAHKALDAMRQMMNRLKLTVNEEKTRICRIPEGKFDFLGYTFGRRYSPKTGRAYIATRPSRKSIKRMTEAVRIQAGIWNGWMSGKW